MCKVKPLSILHACIAIACGSNSVAYHCSTCLLASASSIEPPHFLMTIKPIFSPPQTGKSESEGGGGGARK